MALIISQQTICSLHPTHLIINLTEIHIHHFLVGWRERTWDLGLILLCLGPSPGPILPDADGFNRIDLLGVWECALSPFRAMEEVLDGDVQGEVGWGLEHYSEKTRAISHTRGESQGS